MLESKVERKPLEFWNFKGARFAFRHPNPMIMFDAFITARNWCKSFDKEITCSLQFGNWPSSFVAFFSYWRINRMFIEYCPWILFFMNIIIKHEPGLMCDPVNWSKVACFADFADEMMKPTRNATNKYAAPMKVKTHF